MLYKLCYIVNINTDPTPEGVIRLRVGMIIKPST